MTRSSYKPADTDLEGKLAEWRAANDVPEKPGAMRRSVRFTVKGLVFLCACLLLAVVLSLSPFIIGHAPRLKPFVFLSAVLSLFAMIGRPPWLKPIVLLLAMLSLYVTLWLLGR